MQKQIHIVHIIPTLNFGGAERLVVDMVNNASKEYTFTIVLLKDQQPLAAEVTRDGVDVVVVEKKHAFDLTIISRLKKNLKALQPDVIHTHLFGGDVWGRLAAKDLNIPIVTTEHNHNLDESWWRRWMKRRLTGVSAAYIAPSQSVAVYMQKTYGVPQEKTHVIRNAVSLERFQTIPVTSFSSPVKFVMLGRLVEQKGHTIAFDALKQQEDIPWTLDVYGEGALEQELKQYVIDLKLEDRIFFHPPTRDVPGVFASHDVLLMPSRWEGLGIVIMEAMAAGKLVIGVNVGGIPELIDDKKTGYLIPAEDPRALVAAITLACRTENPASIKQIRTQAREKALHEFGIATMIEAYGRVYAEVISNKQ